ncbi:hypothetical protein SLA2020_103210 [Shorea laevis]
MTSTAGLELDLSWKMVSKGNRSATRRTRKSVAKNSTGGMQLSDGNSRPAEDVTVSDSEKLGVAVLGQRFSDKVEHVPIKKRRFMFRSPSPPPSPPQTPSLQVEVSDQHKDIQSASGQSGFSSTTLKQQTMEIGTLTTSTTGVIDGKFSDVSSEKVGCVEDFSGIEMLAAAACNDGVDDYTDNNEKNPSIESKQARDESSSFPLMPLEETTVLLETDSCTQKDSGNEIKMEDSSLLPPKGSGNEAKMEDSSLLPPKGSENEAKMEDSSLLPPKDSENEVRMEDSSLLSSKDSGHEVKMEDSYLLPAKDSGHEVKIEDLSLLPPQDSGNDDKRVDSSILDNSVAVLHKSPSDKKMGEMSICLPDDRSLWDLNLSMDAWERPCDNGCDDSKNNTVDNIHVDKDAILQNKDLQDKKTDSVDDVVTFEVDRDKCSPSNYGVSPVGTDGLNEKEQELGGCSSLSGNNNRHLSLTANNAADSAKCVDDDVNTSTHLVGMNQCSSPRQEADNITSVMLLKKITETSLSQGNVELGKIDCVYRAEVGKITCTKSVKVEESDVVSPYVPVLENAIKDVERQTVNEDGKTYGGDSGLHDDKISGEDMEICQPLGNVVPKAEPADGAQEVGICDSSLKFEDMLASGLSVVVADVKGQSTGASSSFDPKIGTSAPLEPEKTLSLSESHPATSTAHGFIEACGNDENGPPSSVDKVDATDSSNQNHESAAQFIVAPEAGGSDGNAHCNQNHESAASQDKAFIGGKESSFDLQAGYDSQFEDGELRESDVPSWDEIEQVDYDTEGEEERLCGLEAENNEEKLKSERHSSPGSDDIIEKTKNSGTQDGLGENAVTLNLTTVAVEASESKMDAIDFVDGSANKEYHSALDGSKPSKRELLSGIEASPSCDAVQTSRSDNCDDLNPQAEKDPGPENLTGRDRSTSHIRARSPGGGPYISHSAGQSSPLYHGANPSLRSRPRSAIEGRGYAISADQALSEPADAARTENRIGRHFMGSHSNGMYRPPMRRRSPGERDDSYSMHMRIATVRDTSPDRSRFRRYPQGVSKGIRDEYLRHIPDDNLEYFSRLPSSDSVQRSRSGNFDDSYTQSEREGGSEKFIGRDRPATTRMHGRNPGGGHFFNPSGGIRDEYIRHVADDGTEYFSRLPSSDALRRSRSDNFDDSYPQTEREGGSDKFIGRGRPVSRMRGRSPGGGHFFNPSAGYWDSKRQHSPNHHGAYRSACLRPKSAIEGRGYVVSTDQTLPEPAGVTARPDNRINRHFMSSTSNSGYRPLMRRRSPVERDDSYGMHMRMATVRDGSPDRSRFRRYPQGVGRGMRPDYLRHDPDEATEYITRLPHRLGRRERSISPEGHYVESYKKTRSSSRSRSPMGFLVQRDRNEGSRRHSRLPDFRSDARTDRVRLFPKRFPSDYGESFISPPQDRISPQRNSRVFEDRNSGLDHLRGRKSPVRMLREAKF